MKRTFIQLSNTFKGVRFPTIIKYNTIIHTDINSSKKGTEKIYYSGLDKKINDWITNNNVNILDIKVNRSINNYTIDCVAYITYTNSFTTLGEFKLNEIRDKRPKI